MSRSRSHSAICITRFGGFLRNSNSEKMETENSNSEKMETENPNLNLIFRYIQYSLLIFGRLQSMFTSLIKPYLMCEQIETLYPDPSMIQSVYKPSENVLNGSPCQSLPCSAPRTSQAPSSPLFRTTCRFGRALNPLSRSRSVTPCIAIASCLAPDFPPPNDRNNKKVTSQVAPFHR